MFGFLGSLYKMKKKTPTDLMTLSTVHTLAHLCPPVLGWAPQSNFAYVSVPQVSFLLLGNERQWGGVKTCTVLYSSYIHYFGSKRCWLSFTKWWLEGLPQIPFRCDCLSEVIFCLLVSAMVQLTDILIFKCGW